MKNLKRIIIVALIFGGIGAAYTWFFVYNKKHTDYAREKPEYTMEAKNCFNAFVNNSNESADMLGKVVQIYGTVNKFEEGDSLSTLIFVFNEGMFGDEGIRCVLLPESAEKAAVMNLPAELSLKGYCVGYNETDLILEYCTLIND